MEEDKTYFDPMLAGEDGVMDERFEGKPATTTEERVDTETETTGKPVDTETETTPAEPVAEPEPVVSDDDVVTIPRDRYKEQNRYITMLEQERAEMRRREAEIAREREQVLADMRRMAEANKPQRRAIDFDEFAIDPIKVLREQGFVSREDLDRVRESAKTEAIETLRAEQEQRDFKAFVSAHSDFYDLVEPMQKIYNEIPGIAAMPVLDRAQTLYRLAKASATVKPIVAPSPGSAKKDIAKTAGGSASSKRTGGSGDPHTLTYEEAAKMSEAELEKFYSKGAS